MKFKHLVLCSLLIFSIAVSCNTFKKVMAPPRSTYADTLSGGIVNRVHAGYDKMSASADKSFATWQAFYDGNIYDISVLLVFDSTRKNNAAILELTNDWKKRLVKYRHEHQLYGTLNNGKIIIYQDGMDNAGKKVYLTEENYK